MYKIRDENTISKDNIDGSVSFIPITADNREYKKYLEWIDAGNTPEPADPIVEPEPITEMVYDYAIVATDFRVMSPKIPTNRKKALQDAVKESKKVSKSVAFMTMANTHVLEDLLARVEDLEVQLQKKNI